MRGAGGGPALHGGCWALQGGKTSSGLQPILSSALFRTRAFVCVCVCGKQIAEEESSGPAGRRLVLLWLLESGVEGRREKGRDSEQEAPAQSPSPHLSPSVPSITSRSSPVAHLGAESIRNSFAK